MKQYVKDILIGVILNVIQISVTTMMPFYQKEMFKRIPYTIYMAFAQIFISIPVSFIFGWGERGFKRDVSWVIPPKAALMHLLFSSFSYSMNICLSNLGIVMSSIDLTVLFKSSGIIWNGLFGYLFLKEVITLKSFFSVVSVIIGLLLLIFNFEWNASKNPTFVQVAVQLSGVIIASLSSVSMKMMIKILDTTPTGYSSSAVVFWRYLFALIPTCLLSVWFDTPAWKQLPNMFSTQVFFWLMIGVVLSGMMQYLGVVIHARTSLLTLALLQQIKFIPTLVMSALIYKETKWSFLRLCGASLIIFGSVAYSLGCIKEMMKESKDEQTEDIEMLLPGTSECSDSV